MTEPARYAPRRAIVGWLLFDWAQQPYFTLITTFVYAPYFASAIASDPARGQALWGFSAASAGLAIALFSPVLGAIADAAGRRKPDQKGAGSRLQRTGYETDEEADEDEEFLRRTGIDCARHRR